MTYLRKAFKSKVIPFIHFFHAYVLTYISPRTNISCLAAKIVKLAHLVILNSQMVGCLKIGEPRVSTLVI